MKIAELRERDHVNGVLLCKQKTVGTSKNGKTYYSLQLQDKTGTIDGKIWELNNSINHFESMDFISLDGEVTSFNGALQLNIKRVRVADEGEYNPEDFFPVTPNDIGAMYQELLGLIGSIKNNYLKLLLTEFFVEDAGIVKEFKKHSAAKSMHHGFIGGLLHHTLGVAKLCDAYCTLYPQLQRDLLLTAAMLHDIGKLKELSAFPTNDYTDEGQLIGHIIIGYEMVDDKMKQIPGFPEKLALELKHCILAHHGELEFGSPKKPALPEAIALNLADNTDARMEMLREALEGSKGDWIGYYKPLETNLRKSTELN